MAYRVAKTKIDNTVHYYIQEEDTSEIAPRVIAGTDEVALESLHKQLTGMLKALKKPIIDKDEEMQFWLNKVGK